MGDIRVTEMDLKMIFIVGLVILGLRSTIEAKPTCDQPTCGGTREVAGAPPAEGDGEEGEEKADPCSEDPYSSWRNFLAWSKFCEDGTVGYLERYFIKLVFIYLYLFFINTGQSFIKELKIY